MNFKMLVHREVVLKVKNKMGGLTEKEQEELEQTSRLLDYMCESA